MTHKDLNKFKNLSLSREYFYFAAIVSFIIVSSLIWLLWFSYVNLKVEKDREYSLEAERIEETLEDSFIYTSNFMEFIGRRIVAYGKYDANSVVFMLQTKAKPGKIRDDLFPWTVFEFINSDNYAIASTAGVTEVPLKVDSKKRPWVITARTEPWALHISDPDIGIVSGEYVIPGGYGLKDNHGKFVGMISVGFNIDKLKQKIERSLRSDTSKFIVLTKDLKLITSSEDKKESSASLIQQIKEINFSSHDSGQLDNRIEYDGVIYKYYKTAQPYNYIVLIGQDKDFLYEEFKRLVLPQIVKTLVIWIAFLILLYFFRMKIVNPIVLLSEKARLISRGELDIKMPAVNSSEAAYLVEALEMIKTTFQRENSVRKQLFEANNKIQLINSDLEQKVIERTKDLQHALSVKTEFLNNMSHEIRTPVQGITGLSEGLVENWDALDEDKRLQIANHVASNGRRLLSLVGNLLDLSKFTAGKMLLTFHKIDFNSLIEDMIEESKTLYIGDKKIKFKFINQEPIYAVIDHERIMQVLRNLFVNAIKFSHKNGVINIISSKTESTDDKGEIIKVVQFSITNKGIGIPDDEIKAIFDPFTQSTKTKTSAGGTGLGLAICREIISGHKGRIWAENNEDSTNFSFIVPVTQLIQTTKTKSNTEAKDKQIVTKPANILIIDDEEACLLNMELFLYQSTYTLIKASGGAAGLKYLQEHGISIDLVLLDMMMPDINGLDVLVEIKNRPDLSHLKVILQSGVADEKIVKKAAAIGIDGYIRKPYQKNTVLSEIIKVLSSN